MNGNDETARNIQFTPDGAAKMLARLQGRSASEGTCIVWTGGRAANGYGVTGGALTGRRCRLYTHRVAFALAHGGLEDHVIIRHTCDNPPCINPDHLVAGRTVDNNNDTVERWTRDIAWGSWTGQRGTAHKDAKLDEEKVREIRRRKSNGETLAALAAEFGVSVPSIHLVVHRKSWAHVE